MKNILLKIQYKWILTVTALFILILFVFWKSVLWKQFENKCWDDINFKKTERMLLKAPIKEKIPFHEYYKNQEILKGKTKEKIEKTHFYTYRKQRHEYNSPIFVLFYHNGLKAVFKTKLYKKGRYDVYRAISAYKISKFLNLKIVPPTVIRKINGKEGIVQLFVENISKNKKENLDNLSSIQKSNMYIFLFLTGMKDPTYDNILISKKCFKPVSVDNDNMTLMHAQYGKYPPFEILQLESSYFFLDEEDYKNAPFEKAVELKNLSLQMLEKIFLNLNNNTPREILKMKHNTRLKKMKQRYKSIFYFKYKGVYWISPHIKKSTFIYKHLLPLQSTHDYSPQTIKRLKKLDKRSIKELLVENYKRNQSYINGIFHRRNLILEELKKLKIKESQPK